MDYVMLRDLTILGNGLGTAGDLAGAAARHAAGPFPVIIGFVRCDDLAGFLGHIDMSTDRFGQVAPLQA